MNDEIILEKLKKWVPLFYGKNKEKYATAYKQEDMYVFGWKNYKKDKYILNKVTKAVAIFLTVDYTTFTNFLKKEQKGKIIKRTRTK